MGKRQENGDEKSISCIWQHIPDTHHPLSEEIAPLDPSESIPSHLKHMPLVFDSPNFGKNVDYLSYLCPSLFYRPP